MDFLLHKVEVGDQPMDVDFHPKRPILATGVINGNLLLHTCSPESVAAKHIIKSHDHEHPCRAVRFSIGGNMVFTGSTDKSILAVDVDSGKGSARKRDAHPAPITRLLGVSETVIASGDEDGGMCLWDSRQSDAIVTFDSTHDDFVSDFHHYAPENALLSVSGDGTLALTDLRTNKIREQSEGDADDELLSVCVIKGGKKIVCGTTSGVLDIWSWGYWNDCSDRFPGHPDSVTAIIKYDEDSILTASSDGIIRVLNVQPNKMVGVLGEHGEFDIERLAMDSEMSMLASASHDNTVKIWDLSVLIDDDADEDKGREEQERMDGDRDTDDSDEKDSDDDDAAKRNKKRKKREKRQNKGQHRIKSKKGGSGNDGNNFFADLL